MGAICHLISQWMRMRKTPQAIHVNRENDEWLTWLWINTYFHTILDGGYSHPWIPAILMWTTGVLLVLTHPLITGFGVHEIFRPSLWWKVVVHLWWSMIGRTGLWSESNMGRLTKQYDGMAGMAKGLFKASEAQTWHWKTTMVDEKII